MSPDRRSLGRIAAAWVLLCVAGVSGCTDAGEHAQEASSFGTIEQPVLSSTPSARSSYMAVWDTTNNREILFGGNSATCLNDVWRSAVLASRLKGSGE